MDAAELLKKPYARMVMPDSDGSFVAEIVEFPGCIAVGSTQAEALETLQEVAADWINATLAEGQDIPEPMDAAGFSGKLVLRMSKSLHKRATVSAERDGVSLNQFIVNGLAEQVGLRARAASSNMPRIQNVANFFFEIREQLPPVRFGSLGMTPSGAVSGSIGGLPINAASTSATGSQILNFAGPLLEYANARS